jgi:hypothetical protein
MKLAQLAVSNCMPIMHVGLKNLFVPSELVGELAMTGAVT